MSCLTIRKVISYTGGSHGPNSWWNFREGGLTALAQKENQCVHLAMWIWPKFLLPENVSGAVIQTGRLFLDPSSRAASMTTQTFRELSRQGPFEWLSGVPQRWGWREWRFQVIIVLDKGHRLSKDYERTRWGTVSQALVGHIFRHPRLETWNFWY